MSFLSLILTNAAGLFSEYMAVKLSGRKSPHLMGDEREAHQEDKKEQEKNHADLAPKLVAGWEQGGQTLTVGARCPPQPLLSCPAIV